MRCSILVILALGGTAAADGNGGYFVEAAGGAPFEGDLARFSDGAVRLQLGGGWVRGDWALEASVSIFIPDDQYTTSPNTKWRVLAPPLDLVVANLDVRRAWRILRPRFTRKIGLDMVLHGGPRWAIAETPTEAWAGPGVGGGATLDLNLKAVSMFGTLGMDLAMMRAEDGGLLAVKLPYVGFGIRLGWM